MLGGYARREKGRSEKESETRGRLKGKLGLGLGLSFRRALGLRVRGGESVWSSGGWRRLRRQGVGVTLREEEEDG